MESVPFTPSIEIINTGSELMLGRVLNTHQQWLCAELAALGLVVDRQVAIPDTGPAIQAAIAEAMDRADLVISTGGLGPTSDDVTRELIAELLKLELKVDPSVVEHIERFFAVRNRVMPESARRQAMVPVGATVLQNANGTAPGLVMKAQRNGKERLLVMLPGPPRELRPMFREQVIPILQTHFPTQIFACRTLKTTGIGEIFVEQAISEHLRDLVSQGLDLGYCARVGEVDVRVSARGLEANRKVTAAEGIVRERLGDRVFGVDDQSLEAVVVDALTARKETVALAESCTGGMIAHRITNVPGASAVFMAGLVTYSNHAKQELLGVRPETLLEFGAVSEPTAREMAEGARSRNNTDYAIAVTGIAGPAGGSTEKPVGTVYIAVATRERTIVEKNFNAYDRETFKFLASQQALDLLRRNLRET